MVPESVGILIGIIGIIVAIVAAGISYHNISVTKNIAASSGALKVPQLVLKFGFSSLHSKNSNAQTIVYGVRQIKNGQHVGVIRILVENRGERAAENVHLDVVIPAGANRGYEVLKNNIERGILPGLECKFVRIDKLLHVYYYIPIINPGVPVAIDLPFWIEKTIDFPISANAQTADKGNVSVTFTFTIAFIFRLLLSHKDELPLESNLHVYVMEEKDINATAKRWIDIEMKKDGPFPSDGSSEKQVQWMMGQLERKEFLLVIPVFDKLKVSKKKFLLWEDFDKSERSLLVRSNQKWELHEQK